MAIIHDTTMNPGKLDLLATWMPAQSWYLGGGRAPTLAKAGGFRLDDPQNVSNTPDPTVTVLRAEPAAADGARRGQLTVRVNRVLRPAGPAGQPGLSAVWRLPDGLQLRGILATAEHEPGPRPGDR
jgi:hypothetical protein